MQDGDKTGIILTIFITSITSLLWGCAGPTTPLGAIWSLSPDQARVSQQATKTLRERLIAEVLGNDRSEIPKIHFTPTRQVLHAIVPMTITIEDPDGIPGESQSFGLQVQYNGFDITSSFLRQSDSSITEHGKKAVFTFPSLRLPPTRDHRIEIIYSNIRDSQTYAFYDPPRCLVQKAASVLSTGNFSPSPALLRMIDKISREEGINPAFVVGLIAQESGFNRRAVSYARAMGLTQVTPIAEQEVASRFSDWPRYPGINEMSVPWVKILVNTGKVNAFNEWRFSTEKSVRGGIAYVLRLLEKWSAPANLAKIRTISDEIELTQAKLILASYHSGYSRTMSALEKYGADWLMAPDLQEARKYINSIFSYCDYFSNQEVNHARTS